MTHEEPGSGAAGDTTDESEPRPTDRSNRFPVGYEDDDGLRSQLIHALMLDHPLALAEPRQKTSRTSSTAIPRTLVRYWHDRAIPLDVKACLDSWDRLEDDGFSLRLFNNATAATYINSHYGRSERLAFRRCRHPAMQSDYFRLCFILAEGGLYVDADDLLCGDGWQPLFTTDHVHLQPLCYDLRAGRMAPSAELRHPPLSNPQTAPGKIFYVNNNPIAGPAGHPLLVRALAQATRNLSQDRPATDIQAATGPGNLTRALAIHGHEAKLRGDEPDYAFINDWETTAQPDWDLTYRRDNRNWRRVFPN